MPRIAAEEVAKIREEADIVEIISDYIPLTQRGKNFFGVCPFHQDHSPSMSVSREKQMFKCFSCGAAGNVFKFVSDYENISFVEAIERVAAKIGMSIHISNTYKPKEKYAREIVETAINGRHIAFDKTNNRVVPCNSILCADCLFHREESCLLATEAWANAEYKEPRQFTVRERLLLICSLKFNI